MLYSTSEILTDQYYTGIYSMKAKRILSSFLHYLCSTEYFNIAYENPEDDIQWKIKEFFKESGNESLLLDFSLCWSFFQNDDDEIVIIKSHNGLLQVGCAKENSWVDLKNDIVTIMKTLYKFFLHEKMFYTGIVFDVPEFFWFDYNFKYEQKPAFMTNFGKTIKFKIEKDDLEVLILLLQGSPLSEIEKTYGKEKIEEIKGKPLNSLEIELNREKRKFFIEISQKYRNEEIEMFNKVSFDRKDFLSIDRQKQKDLKEKYQLLLKEFLKEVEKI